MGIPLLALTMASSPRPIASHHCRDELSGRQLWLGLDTLPGLLGLIISLPAKDGPDDRCDDHTHKGEEIYIHEDDVHQQAPTEAAFEEERASYSTNQVAAVTEPGGVEDKAYEEEDEPQHCQDLDYLGELEAAAEAYVTTTADEGHHYHDDGKHTCVLCVYVCLYCVCVCVLCVCEREVIEVIERGREGER